MKALRSAAGFTLVEAMVVLCVVSILVRISIPAYDAIRREAVASQALGDFNAVRAGVVAQFEATGSYPADAPSGSIPAGLTGFLPAGFSFRRPAYELDWENYTVPDTSGSGVTQGQVLALTVTAHDPTTGLQILRQLGANCSHWSVGDSHTFVMFSSVEAGR